MADDEVPWEDEEPAEGRLTTPDDRVVAWTEWGDPDGRPLLRVPGTPGCRWSVRADRRVWAERGLRVVTTERPGFGASTRLPGRGFREHADDLARVLDEVGIDRVHLAGGSGAAPHELALCQYHPDRVSAASVVAGACPVEPEEMDRMIPLNASVYRSMREGRRSEAEAVMAPIREQVLLDPLAAFDAVMATAPPEDLEVMRDPLWQKGFARAQVEALSAGLDGWVDEAEALASDWPDVDPAAVPTSITWYHAVEDRNCPIEAARRLVDRLPNARFVEWRDAGHLTAYHREGELLDELLARG